MIIILVPSIQFFIMYMVIILIHYLCLSFWFFNLCMFIISVLHHLYVERTPDENTHLKLSWFLLFFKKIIIEESSKLVHETDNLTFWSNTKYFNIATSREVILNIKWKNLVILNFSFSYIYLGGKFASSTGFLY